MRTNFLLKIIANIPYILYFNFHYLPFKQAVKIPILLFRPKLGKCKGKIVINSNIISFGMIRLGFHGVSIFENTGFKYENHGGEIIFKGKCYIGSGSAISVGSKGKCIIGGDFSATYGFKLVNYYYIEFKDRICFGWNPLIMDTGFHPLKSIQTHKFVGKAYGPIVLGKNNWFGNGVLIMKNTKTSDYCTFGARSVLTKNYKTEPYSLLVGTPPRVVKEGLYCDMNDCTEIYNEYK